MTAQTASYGMDYINHAQPEDVLKWIVSGGEPLINFNFGCGSQSCIKPKTFIVIRQLQKGYLGLTIPCHQFAASVVGRLLDSIDIRDMGMWYRCIFQDGNITFFAERNITNDRAIPINPFHGMTMPDGSPRTSCTREEFETWKKELEA